VKITAPSVTKKATAPTAAGSPERPALRGGAMAKRATSRATSIDKHVGTRLRVRRMMLGMSQPDIGDALGVTFQQVQKYESGVNRIGAGRLHQIAGILGVPVTFFFEGTSASAKAGSLPAEDPMGGLANSGALRLVMAFTRITDRELRRQIVRLVEKLAGPE
jgi:transcriptional regulator with XRE-family HTH domain